MSFGEDPGLRRSRRGRKTRRLDPPDDLPELEVDENRDARLEVVRYKPVRCPRCDRSKRQTYGRAGRVRYHRCQDCTDDHGRALRFRSVEE